VRIVKTTYNDTGYYALYFPTESQNRITFDGLFWGDPIEISDATEYPVTEVSYNTGPYAIVETGSNTSGRWIKFSDGTMIQTKIAATTNTLSWTLQDSAVGSYGWSLYCARVLNVPYPDDSFISTPAVFISIKDSASMKYITANDDFVTKDYFGFQIDADYQRDTMKYNMLAIGRWRP